MIATWGAPEWMLVHVLAVVWIFALGYWCGLERRWERAADRRNSARLAAFRSPTRATYTQQPPKEISE